jgi:hypothetical protein
MVYRKRHHNRAGCAACASVCHAENRKIKSLCTALLGLNNPVKSFFFKTGMKGRAFQARLMKKSGLFHAKSSKLWMNGLIVAVVKNQIKKVFTSVPKPPVR